jgi:DnaJ-class molecular chaperone
VTTKIRVVACSRCNGSGEIDVHTPHISTPHKDTCPQCNGHRSMAMLVPDEYIPEQSEPRPEGT